MTFSERRKFRLAGLVAFVLIVIVNWIAPIRLPAYFDLALVGIGLCFMVLMYYRETRDLWAPIVSVTGWIISGIPPRAWVLWFSEESVAVMIAFGTQVVGGGLFLLGIGLGGYRLFKLSNPKNPSR